MNLINRSHMYRLYPVYKRLISAKFKFEINDWKIVNIKIFVSNGPTVSICFKLIRFSNILSECTYSIYIVFNSGETS